MSKGNFFDTGGYLDYGDAAALLPVEELQARVYTHRDAERVLGDAPADSVLAIRPTGLASSYALTQRPLAAIEIASLDDELREQLDRGLATDLAQFDLIQVGRATTPAQNLMLGTPTNSRNGWTVITPGNPVDRRTF